MNRSFNLLIIKYKVLKDECNEKELATQRKQKELDNMQILYKDIKRELSNYNLANTRLKEINRCLLDDNKKSYVEVGGIQNVHFNSNNILLTEELEDHKNAATHIEPMPSFLKFLDEST